MCDGDVGNENIMIYVSVNSEEEKLNKKRSSNGKYLSNPNILLSFPQYTIIILITNEQYAPLVG